MKRGMKYAVLGVFVGLFLYHVAAAYIFPPEVRPVFSPGEGGQEVISLIDSAQSSLDIEIYVFTSRDVIEALERAKSRGVEIRIIMERRVMSGQNDATYRELAAKGFDVRYARTDVELTHSKFIIVDGKSVLVGSHNLSNSALYENREASVIVSDAATVAEFSRIFAEDWAGAG